MDQHWKFTEISRLEDLTFNKVLERFHEFGVDGLVRENIQNSLDGKLQHTKEPVYIEIQTGTIRVGEIPGINEVFKHVRALRGQNEYTKETIEHMNMSIKASDDEVSFISFEDSNTKGLSGAKNGHSGNPEDTWSAYAYNKGVHHVEADESAEKVRGGSHGIGKIASNAASDQFMMFFANCDEYGNKHLGGTVQLMEHELEGKNYRATGYFSDLRGSKFIPFENQFHSVFSKDTRGLKIVIPFFKDKFNNEVEIIKSVCDNFFVAILEGKLIVKVNALTIDVEGIKAIIQNTDYYPLEIEGRDYRFTPYYLNTFTNFEPLKLIIEDGKREKYEFNLYFNYDLAITKGRVGIIRTVGMKIEDKKIRNNVNKPFNAVLMPSSLKEDSYLKSLENESHTELSSEHIKNPKEEKAAKTFINNISREIAKVIDDYMRQNNPTDGLLNTNDILYDVETTFKNDLSSSTTNLTLNIGKKDKTIIKVKSHEKKKPREKKEQTETEKPKGTRKVTKKLDGDSPRVFYKIRPSLVQRAILAGNEHLNIDLRQEAAVVGKKTCDLYLVVIDGMGNEYTEEMKLNEAYKQVVDRASEVVLSVEEKSIRRIPIKNSMISLKCTLNESFNRTLKFAYYLEV